MSPVHEPHQEQESRRDVRSRGAKWTGPDLDQDCRCHDVSEYLLQRKVILCVGESVKKGTAEDVDKFRGEIMQNHDKKMGFQEVAQALTRNGNTFGGNNGFLLNGLDLQPDVEGEEDDEQVLGMAPTQ